MSGAIIAVSNQKGGVGKTTLTVHLAVYLARKGRKIILVDCDPQGNATSWILDGDVSQDGIFRLLVVGETASGLARMVEKWGIRLLPGNHRTGEAMVFLAATAKPFTTIAQMLEPLRQEADYILVDMPPSKSMGFSEILFAADWVLVPTQLERLSLEGVTFMAQTARSLSDKNGRGPRLLGIVPNMVRKGTVEHQDQLQNLVDTFGPVVWPPIPLSVRVAEACAFGKTLFDHAPHEAVTRSLVKIGERLVQNLEVSHG
jgi:chromosome partitioning protein